MGGLHERSLREDVDPLEAGNAPVENCVCYQGGRSEDEDAREHHVKAARLQGAARAAEQSHKWAKWRVIAGRHWQGGRGGRRITHSLNAGWGQMLVRGIGSYIGCMLVGVKC